MNMPALAILLLASPEARLHVDAWPAEPQAARVAIETMGYRLYGAGAPLREDWQVVLRIRGSHQPRLGHGITLEAQGASPRSWYSRRRPELLRAWELESPNLEKPRRSVPPAFEMMCRGCPADPERLDEKPDLRLFELERKHDRRFEWRRGEPKAE